MGTGDVTNNVGASNNQADKSITCYLKLKVYHSRKQKGALYLAGAMQSSYDTATRGRTVHHVVQ